MSGVEGAEREDFDDGEAGVGASASTRQNHNHARGSRGKLLKKRILLGDSTLRSVV
jgi:hypothetical protein